MSQTQLTTKPVVAVPAAQAGGSVTVASEAGANLHFQFDPAAADISREGTDLVFSLDNGGVVTIGGFFEVGDNSLPDLTLPDGTVVAAGDFFNGSGLDMTTAAGSASGAPASGGTSYDDDPGALLLGLDKYGKLGTDYWGRETENTEFYQGLTGDAGEGIFGAIVGGISFGDIAQAEVFESDTYLRDGWRGTNTEAEDNGAVFSDPGSIPFSFGPMGPAAANAFVWDRNVLDADGNPVFAYRADGTQAQVFWTVSEDGLTLTGYAGPDGPAVITVSATLTDAGADYDVTLHGGIVHAQGEGHDDALDVNFGFTLTDGAGAQASGALPVTVHDDEIVLIDSNADMAWGGGPGSVGVDFATGFAEGAADLKLDENGAAAMDGFTIGVGRVVYDDPANPLGGTALTEGSGELGVWAGHGLGVRGSDHDNQVWEGRAGWTDENSLTRPKEVGFENTGDKNSSEAVVIDLENSAMGMTLSLQHFYKGVGWENDERGLIIFYKLVNGEYVQVHSETFDAYSANGDFTATFPNGYGGTFDRVAIAGVQVEDHPDSKSDVPDNSDFVISGVAFEPPYGEAEGTVGGYSADGVAGYTWGDLEGWTCTTVDGREITLEDGGDGTLYGRFGADETAFTVTLDPETGEWSFSMLTPFSPKEGGLDFPVVAVDHDGDLSDPGSISVGFGPQIVDGFSADAKDVFTGVRGVEDLYVWNEDAMSNGQGPNGSLVDAIHNFELGVDKISFHVSELQGLLDGNDTAAISELLESGTLDIFKSGWNQDCWTLRMSGTSEQDGQLVDIFVDKNSLDESSQALLDSVGANPGANPDTSAADTAAQLALLQVLLGGNS